MTPIQPAPWVEFQGDQCIGDDGARYISTIEPKNVDTIDNMLTWGLPVDAMNSSNGETNQPHLKTLNQVWTLLYLMLRHSISQIVFSFFSEIARGKKKESDNDLKWAMYDQVDVSRVPQDVLIQIVYKTVSETYYSTTNVRGVELPTKQILCLERLPNLSAFRIVELYGNEYVILDWSKVSEKIWGRRKARTLASTHTYTMKKTQNMEG